MTRGETAVRRKGSMLGALGVLIVFALALIVAAPAMASKDPLAGGSTTLALKLPKKVKVSAISPAKKTGKKTVKFKIASGSMDPVTCTGSEKLKGGMKFKYKGKKVKVTKVKAAFGGPVYTPHKGSLKGKVGKKKNVKIASITGGKCSRNGFGAKVTNAKMKLTKKGAKALDKGLKQKNKPFKKGKKFGTASTKTIPSTVDVNSGVAHLTADTTTLGKLGTKGVNAAHGGVAPIPPTSFTPPLTFNIPINGGTIAPDGNNGTLTTSATGGARFTKTDNTGVAACDSSTPIGTHNDLTGVGIDLFANSLFADLTVVGGNLDGTSAPATTLADITGKVVSANASTRTITVTSPSVQLTSLAAGTINAIYGTTQTQTCGANLAGGDSLGSLSITVNTH